VTAPPSEIATGGLFGAASNIYQGADLPGGNRWECGIEYEQETCGDVAGWHSVCPPEAPTPKPATLQFPLTEGIPFTAVLGVQCPLVGYTLDEFERRVHNAHAANVARAVEEIFWTGSEDNNSLAGTAANPSDCEVLSATPLSVVGGISALEGFLASSYGGVGVVHAPATVAAYAAQAYQIERSGNQRLTPLGHRWAFGGGYMINTGPDGVPAAAGTAWLYATGAVNIWRSEVWINPSDLQYAFNTRTNDTLVYAEQNYVVTSECVCAAVPVSLSCDC
jgi:hypothetical protein